MEGGVPAPAPPSAEAEQLLQDDLMMGVPDPGRARDLRANESRRRQARLTRAMGGDERLDAAVVDGCFAPVDPELVGHFGSWCPVLAGRWQRPVKILRGEGRALVMGLRHCLRSAANFGTRTVILSDNLSLVWH